MQHVSDHVVLLGLSLMSIKHVLRSSESRISYLDNTILDWRYATRLTFSSASLTIMDPVTAFSLAAGVIQVIDCSFKVVKICRELKKDGSLAPHRNTEELADTLGMHVLVLGVLVWHKLSDAAYRPLPES